MSAAAMTDSNASLSYDALDACLAFADALRATTIGAWLELDLSMVELKALLAIARRHELTISKLAVILRLGRPGASRVAD